jgi:hAT family C-terminal dimerisation region
MNFPDPLDSDIEEMVVPIILSRKATVQCTISSSGKTDKSKTQLPPSMPITWKKRPPGRKATSKVWDYFVYDSASDYSSCSIDGCTSEKIKGKNASNLKKHLQYVHKTQHDLVTKADVTEKPTVTPKRVQEIEIPANQLRLKSGTSLVDFKYDKENPKQIKWGRQIAIMFGANPIPNFLVTNDDFRKTYQIADPKLIMPSRRSLEKNIDNLMTDMKQKITERLNLARRINISSDIWTKPGMTGSYLGVMATIYDQSEKKKLNLALSVKKFKEVRHTAENIYEEMLLVLKSYNIPSNKIWKMVTDSGSNMVCAFRDQVFYFSELAQDVDTEEIEESVDTVDEEDPTEFPIQTHNRLSCFIHSLLLCLKKFDAGKIFENIVTKVKLLVSKFSSSQVLTGELLRLSGLKLLSFSNTRWNVTFLVIQRLLLVKDSVVLVLRNCDKQKYDLTDAEWKLLAEIEDYLAPFNKFTDMSSTEGTRALSEVVMILKQLENHLKGYSNKRPFVTVSKGILKELTDRFGHFFSENGTHEFEGVYLSSTLLDPRYRIGLKTAEKDLAVKYIVSSNWEWESANAENHASQPSTNTELPKKKRKFEFLQEIGDTNSTQNLGLVNEVNLYLENKLFDIDDDKCDPWNFWNQYKTTFPKLHSIALEILSIPLSIGHVERIFSFAGLATGGRRNRLDGGHLDREVLLNKNKHLIKID